MIEEDIERIKEIVFREKKIAKEMVSLFNYIQNADVQEKKMLQVQAGRLRITLKGVNHELRDALEETGIERQLPETQWEVRKAEEKKAIEKKIEIAIKKMEKLSDLDKEVLQRLKKKKKKGIQKKAKKASGYAKFSSSVFGEIIKNKIKNKKFANLEKDLIKSNMGYTPVTYISIMTMTTLLSIVIGAIITIFLLFFNLGPELPIITRVTESFSQRLLKVFWIAIVAPLGTLLFMYIYPSLEKKTVESKINEELPFATIHMAAISGSMIEPTKVFSIICSTKEYPHLEQELNKLLNEINIYGYDIVTALKNISENTPSLKLSELLNGLATTITSGGELYEFFDKRAQTLLFEYRLEKEKRTKTAETFMDIYISVVIAAPMILMLLLMMMKISGLGVSISTSLISVIVVGGVSLINIFFLIFLQVKQPTG
jgi:pilus assembly protein TadC